jgi:hypothetical protein
MSQPNQLAGFFIESFRENPLIDAKRRRWVVHFRDVLIILFKKSEFEYPAKLIDLNIAPCGLSDA